MKIRCLSLTLAALCLLGGQLLKADILILKNGEKKEGNIIEERADAVRMKYKITPKIWDEKDFPREDIQQIIKQKPEEIEIVELRKVLPADDLLTANQYEQIIQEKLRPFMNKYPGTPEAKEIDGVIAELQKEKDRVVAGELKLEGQWLKADVVKRDDYNIQAYKIRRAMQKKAAEQDYNGALREFDRLADPASGYPASTHYAKAIPEVTEIMTKFEAVVTRMISEQPILQKQRDDSLTKLVEPDLGRTKAAISREQDSWKATYDAEKKAKVRWMTLYKYDLKSLETALKTLIGERGKLQLVDLSKLQSQNEALTKVLHYLADENATEAENALKAAQALALRESSQMISQLRSRISAMKSEQARNKRTNGSVGAGSTAVAGSSAAIQDDRVAKAMADAEKARGEKKGGAEDKPEAGNKEDDRKSGEDDKKKTKAKSKPRAADGETPVVAPPAEEGGVSQYLLIGAGILIVVLLAALLLQKKKG